ncbi:hypothetical protein AAIH51_31515, partial [Pseudomonas aeruginosa]
KKSRGTSRIVTDAITIQNPRNRGGSTGHVLAKRSVTFTEIRSVHGKSYHCATWKAVYALIDEAVATHGLSHIHDWLHRLATRHENARLEGLSRAVDQHFSGGE